MTIQTEQIDDLPLLFGLLQKMGLQAIVDEVIEPVPCKNFTQVVELARTPVGH